MGSSNESCIAPSPAAVAAMADAATHANRYPGITGERLAQAIAGTLGLDAGQVVVGGGSLALLGHILSAYAPPGSSVIHAWRSYEAYPILIALAGAESVPVALDGEHYHDLAAMGEAITIGTRVVLVCNPNNPTGTVLEPGEIEAFLEKVPGHVLVVLDEAYREFSSPEAESGRLLERYPNLVILRTFSKAYGLAGARAGYLLAGPGVAANIRAVAPPFGLSSLAEAGALAAWADTEYLAESVSEVVSERDFLLAGLLARGLRIPPSGGNFLWIPAGARSLDLESSCVAHGVSVRAFPGSGVRVTISVRDASNAVLAAIDALRPQLPGGQAELSAVPAANHDHSTGGAS
ncbi:aminotransferase class I/II-fold pyridoxal phosphate-dependent enzyme [Paeniglutamicibacter cryotolerans]|uniref:Histidinol-phosphate aminotransferase n=1 Tax=Paeniglutamicibacter cryotolerans TaxID=670079 RepID=A0A839QHT6_9MICC|nr:aminotransferase class I/II-fold pyridoxal phosphate-dependent enzyme [Paeniglutamicibacter cryotolerans]MBB2995440.1 histidinol-phosphate aminotransferase [Paeniglutamicibacter cryotolerans]